MKFDLFVEKTLNGLAKNKTVAKKIAIDHLFEYPKYYTKLKKNRKICFIKIGFKRLIRYFHF